MAHDTLLTSLRARSRAEIGGVVRPGPVALLDFPDYANPGDSAIWLGALACLSDLGFAPPVYTSDERTFDERMLRRALPRGTILLTGGGSFGDLWPRHQKFRERVLNSFPDHAIVQLPQSIYFGDARALATARAVFSAHRDVTLLVRDAKSLEVATAQLDCRAVLCPDLALCLAPETEPALRPQGSRARVDTLRLLRTDHEGTGALLRAGPAVDWVIEAPWLLGRFTRRMGNHLAAVATADREASWADHGVRALLSAAHEGLARRRLRRGAKLLQSARVVVTDRLHGHILALLLGVPHVVVGDRNGKLRGFIETWTSSAEGMRWAESIDDAERLAGELLSCS